MKVVKYPKKENWETLLKRPFYQDLDLESKVKKILDETKKSGDKALFKFSLKFDRAHLSRLKVTDKEISDADGIIGSELKNAIKIAFKNILKFHTPQLSKETQIKTTPGVVCWRKSVPIEKIGLYIPGGSAPLFSTVLMLGVPAQIAGCKNVVLCTPPDKNGNINPAILYAATLTGITDIYKVGGAQAIAAMGYGTESIPNVYKIFGPGNNYVNTAKQLLQKEGVAFDMPAGPSEIAILADESADAAFVAADLLSQAEHGPDSQVIFVTTSDDLIDEVIDELEKQTRFLSRKEIVKQTLANSKTFLVKTLAEGMDLLNEYAPEHLIIACNDAETLAEKVINAGSVFIGNYTPESAGDYASGTNHTLPTNGWTKAYSGVSVDSFLKKITFQKITKEGLRKIGPVIEVMAAAEGLDAHKNAITIRLKK